MYNVKLKKVPIHLTRTCLSPNIVSIPQFNNLLFEGKFYSIELVLLLKSNAAIFKLNAI